MMDRMRALEINQDPTEPSIQSQILDKVIGLCKDGGFRCVYQDGAEYFGVMSSNGLDKFDVMIWNSGAKMLDRSYCSIVRFNQDESTDQILLETTRRNLDETVMFRGEHTNAGMQIGDEITLTEEQMAEFLNSFLSSELDDIATVSEFDSVREDEEVISGFAPESVAKLQWVRDINESTR